MKKKITNKQWQHAAFSVDALKTVAEDVKATANTIRYDKLKTDLSVLPFKRVKKLLRVLAAIEEAAMDLENEAETADHWLSDQFVW